MVELSKLPGQRGGPVGAGRRLSAAPNDQISTAGWGHSPAPIRIPWVMWPRGGHWLTKHMAWPTAMSLWRHTHLDKLELFLFFRKFLEAFNKCITIVIDHPLRLSYCSRGTLVSLCDTSAGNVWHTVWEAESCSRRKPDDVIRLHHCRKTGPPQSQYPILASVRRNLVQHRAISLFNTVL